MKLSTRALACAAVLALSAAAADARGTNNNLKQISLGVTLYEADFFAPFPPVVDHAEADRAVLRLRKSGCDDPCATLEVSYFTLAAGGGLSIADDTGLRFSAFGEQLFTGPPERPTFRLGEFAFDHDRDGAPIDARLTVTSVPEPASWGLMIAGFGLTGAAARRRRGVMATRCETRAAQGPLALASRLRSPHGPLTSRDRARPGGSRGRRRSASGRRAAATRPSR